MPGIADSYDDLPRNIASRLTVAQIAIATEYDTAPHVGTYADSYLGAAIDAALLDRRSVFLPAVYFAPAVGSSIVPPSNSVLEGVLGGKLADNALVNTITGHSVIVKKFASGSIVPALRLTNDFTKIRGMVLIADTNSAVSTRSALLVESSKHYLSDLICMGMAKFDSTPANVVNNEIHNLQVTIGYCLWLNVPGGNAVAANNFFGTQVNLDITIGAPVTAGIKFIGGQGNMFDGVYLNSPSSSAYDFINLDANSTRNRLDGLYCDQSVAAVATLVRCAGAKNYFRFVNSEAASVVAQYVDTGTENEWAGFMQAGVKRTYASVVGVDNRTGLTANDGAPITLFAVPAGAGQLYRVSMDVFATAYTSGTITYTLTWTENGGARTATVTATAINVLGTLTDLINPDASTNITVQLTGFGVATVKVAAIAEKLLA